MLQEHGCHPKSTCCVYVSAKFDWLVSSMFYLESSPFRQWFLPFGQQMLMHVNDIPLSWGMWKSFPQSLLFVNIGTEPFTRTAWSFPKGMIKWINELWRGWCWWFQVCTNTMNDLTALVGLQATFLKILNTCFILLYAQISTYFVLRYTYTTFYTCIILYIYHYL